MGIQENLHSISGSTGANVAILSGVWSIPTLSGPAVLVTESVKLRGDGIEAGDGSGTGNFGAPLNITGVTPADTTFRWSFTLTDAWGPVLFSACQCTQGEGLPAGLLAYQCGSGAIDRAVDPISLAMEPGGLIQFNIFGADNLTDWTPISNFGLQVAVTLIVENIAHRDV